MFALLAGRPPFRAKTMPEMLQLQRFAEPEPVRRYAPQTPEQLDRLIRQLLSKEPAERFPNVLVLARHMEAMQQALSRPGKPAVADGSRRRGSTRTTQLDIDGGLQRRRDAGAGGPVDHAAETTDSGVYNAPTLADEANWRSAAAVRARRRRRRSASRRATDGRAPPRASRFTTVDEDARAAVATSSRRSAGMSWLQLVGIGGGAGALGVVGLVADAAGFGGRGVRGDHRAHRRAKGARICGRVDGRDRRIPGAVSQRSAGGRGAGVCR